MFSDSWEWQMWQAARDLGEPIYKARPSAQNTIAVAVTTLRTAKRKKHWAGKFQKSFAAWLRGAEHRPYNFGYSRRELIRHLERQFVNGMSWDNYAGSTPFRTKRVWVVDHIVPKSSFGEDDVASAYALSNLRPLWSDDNKLKGRRRTHLL